MSAAGQEQFGAIPVRAFSDNRLSVADFRVLGVIASRDRFGRNGTACTLGARKLAEQAKINPAHLARHTKRLEELGYITIERSEADKRRLIYAVVYEEAKEIVTMDGDYSGEIVTIVKSQVAENKSESARKRSCKTRLRDPAKQVSFARQGEPDRSTVPRQRELPVMQDVNKGEQRRWAEERLGNDLIRANLIGQLETILGKSLAETTQYNKAIKCEAERKGTGLAYMLGIVRKARAA